MIRGFWLVVIATLVPAATAQEQYTIQFKKGGKGQETTTALDTRIRISVGKWDAMGQQIVDDLRVIVTKMAYSTVVLEEHGERASVVKRHCSKAVKSVDGGPEEADALQGTTLLLVTGEDGSQTALSEKGDPVPDSLLQHLKSRPMSPTLTRFEDLLPKKPVRVGESWPIDAASWVKRDDVALTATQGTAQLVKVYRKDGRLSAPSRPGRSFALRSMRVPGRLLSLQPGSKILVKSVREGCIDGTSTECAERGSYLFNAVVRDTGPDGLETKMDQQIELTLSYTAK